MKNISIVPFLMSALAAVTSLHSAMPVWDTGAGAGIQASSGDWDVNTTENWTLDNGVTHIPWTSSSDVALFSLQGTNGTVTINNTNGQVGTAGLIFEGATATSGSWSIVGDTFQLGASGMRVDITNDTNTLSISAGISLTASQTWTSQIGRASNGSSGVVINGIISNPSGTTNLTFDGQNRYASTNVSANPRVSFSLGGANTYTGSTTVTGGAQLVLNYTTGNSSRLSDSNALILAGGSIMMNGGTDYTETVGSTTLNAGHSSIITGPNGAGGTTNHLSMGAITHNTGATFDVSNAVSDLARTSSSTSNGLLGGWATVGSNRFATVNPALNNAIVSTTGSVNNMYSTWTTANNVVVSAAVDGTTNTTINSLRVASGGSVALATGQTLTVASGGIIGDSGTAINGGNLNSGLASGELFIHTPSALTISSAIVDNGATKTILVKAGTNTLTISGNNTYTGGTYINAGTLIVTGSAVLQGEITQAGATTLSIGAGGTLSPGEAGSAGTMSLGGNLSLNNGTILSLQLGTLSDTIVLANSFATLTGSAAADGITLNLSNIGASVQTYSLIQWNPSVTLSGFDLSDFSVITSGGLTGTLQLGTNSLDYVVSAVPEPSTVAIATCGLGGLFLLRRRRTAICQH